MEARAKGIHHLGGSGARWLEPANDASKVMDQHKLNFALQATATGLWSFDSRDATLHGDQRVHSLIGSTGDGPMALATFLGVFADDQQAIVYNALHAPEQSAIATSDLELRFNRLDNGEEGWVAIRARRDRDIGQVIGTARDITGLKRNDLHVHMLIREVTHRSKNLLAIIQAMARQTVKDSLSAADFEARFSARLRGLSFSHELLASQDWRGAALSELAEGHLSGLREQHGERVQIVGPTVFVRPEAAQNIGLALNELSSNAQRFGALSGEQGTVRLEWHIIADETGPHALNMIWSESGASTNLQPPSRQGFGHKVMERVVARALDGTVTMSYNPTGLRWTLRMPLTNIANAPYA